jgi:two-component system response regulator
MTLDPTMPGVANVLLVEDNESDVTLTRESLEDARLSKSLVLHHVWNGQECLKFLRKEQPYANAPTPDLILLDLNMPVMSGREVIREMVNDPELAHLPVVVMTTSQADRDVIEMYRMRVNSYVVKPVDFAEFVRVVRELGEYWFAVVVLPNQDEV